MLHKTHCHCNIFDISRANVVDMLVPLLVRCNFDLFKCWCFMFLPWSINLMFLFVHISFRWLFTIWALCWCLSFLVMMLEIETSQVGDFADMARDQQLILHYLLHFIWRDVISSNMENNMIWFILYYKSFCRWFFWDISSCWILTFVLFFISSVTEKVLVSDGTSCFAFASSLLFAHNFYESQWRHHC